ncbi:MAG TPA: hypothetical protein VFM18_19250 [Methanosarcina sp.]|nr:hypothetical protein [Methanosarcina sp.]
MNIYALLTSVPHNPHYLNRYYKFITSRKTTIGDKHHICPKAHDMFPQFTSFKTNPWNKIVLTGREHYIAHLFLHKAYGKSQTRAFYMMSSISRISSRYYEIMRLQHKEFMKTNNPMNDPENRKKCIQHGELNGMFGKVGGNKGKTGEKSHLYGKKRPEHSAKMSGQGNPNFGVSPKKQTCEHCRREIGYTNYARWHGDKCKLRAPSTI